MTAIERDALLYPKTGKADKLEECLKRGVSPNCEGFLYYAAKNGHLNVITLLLSKGVDPDDAAQKDTGGSGPLHYAAWAGHIGVVKKLIAAGANPNGQNNEGGTPLTYAREKQRNDVISILEGVTRNTISYSIDEALALPNPVEAYYTLRSAILKDWHRGYSPAELRFLSLERFHTFGLPNGIDDMLWQGGLWSITSAIELFDAIAEPACAEFLREGLEIIRDQCERSGIAVDADVGTRLEFDDQAKAQSSELSSRAWAQTLGGGDEVYAKTMAYVAQHRSLYSEPGSGPS